MSSQLVKLDAARRALAEAKTLDEKLEIRDKAEALRGYFKTRQYGLEAQNEAAEIKILAERDLGGIIQAMQRRGELPMRDSGRPKKGLGDQRLILSDFHVSYYQSHQWQRMTDTPDELFYSYLATAKNGKKELTTAAVMRQINQHFKELGREREAERIDQLAVRLPSTEHEQCFYQDGWTQIWWGDAADLHFIADNIVDLIVTSPPYNIGPKESSGRILWGGVKYATSDDRKPEDQYQAEQIAALNELWRVTRPGGSLFYNHKIRNRKGVGIHPLAWLAQTKWIFRQQIVWDRGSTHNHEMTYFWPHDELIFWLTKGTDGVYLSPEGAEMSTIWRFNFNTNTDHPAPFPEELAARCIKAASQPGNLVLDPFGGSMTVCRAAKKLKRLSIGVDIEKQYVVKYAAYCSQLVLL